MIVKLEHTTDSSLSLSSSSSSAAAIISPLNQPVMSNMSNISSTSIKSPSTNLSSSIHTIDLSTSTTSFTNVTTEHATGHDPSSTAAAVVVFVTVMGVAIVAMLIFILIRRKRKLSYLPFPCDSCSCCMPGRKRHNSNTSFNNPLTTTDDTDLVVPQERELFSIGDQDGGSDGRVRTRGRVVADDDYFYDEIFERSAFTDERTNQTNKQLTVEDFEDEFDIPDLIFRPQTTFKMT